MLTLCLSAAEPAAETSDDDIQLLSSGEEEKEDGHAEDSNNSGSHTDDTCNVPDSLGRVLVNVGHPPAEMDIFIAPQIARNIKPHQVSRCCRLGRRADWAGEKIDTLEL